MTQRGPWSVKGIDSRAREVAREAAREEGMTLGAYLNRLILEEGTEPDLQSARTSSAAQQSYSEPRHRPTPEPARSSEPSSTALDRLTRRIESAEARSTLAITGIDQSVVGLLSRLENAEHNQQAMGGHFEGVMDDIQKTYEALSVKVKRVEEDDSSASNLRALKALEDALGKLASHVYEENELVGEETNAIKARLESGLGELSERMANIDNQIEGKLETATSEFHQAISEAELRTEGISKHLAERFTSVELEVSDKLTHVGQMSATMDGVHADVSNSLVGINDTLGQMQERLSRAETLTDKAMHGLEARFESLDSRLASVQVFANEDADASMRKHFDERFESLSEDLRQLVAATRVELAEEIEAAAKSVDEEVLNRIEGSLSGLAGRLDASEDLHAQTMEMVGDTVSRVTESVDQRLSATQDQQARAIDQVGQQVTRISEGLDQRLNAMEATSGKAETDALREEMIRFTNTLDERLEYLETREDDAFEKVTSQVGQLADRLDERVTESEKRAATAIGQVGEQVAGASKRLEQRQSEALRLFSEKLDGTQKRQESRLSSALENVSDRLERMQEQSLRVMSPVQKAISALAQRIEAVEDFSAPPYADRGQAPAIPTMVAPTKIDTSFDTNMPDAASVAPMEPVPEMAPVPAPVASKAAAEFETDELRDFLNPIFKAEPETALVEQEEFSDFDLMAADLEIGTAPSKSNTHAATAEPAMPDAQSDTEIEDFELGYKNWADDANAVLDDALGTDVSADQAKEFDADISPENTVRNDDSLFFDNEPTDVRASDIFETEDLPQPPPLGAELDKINAFEDSADYHDRQPSEADDDDYIGKARRAAREAAMQAPGVAGIRSSKKKASGGANSAQNNKKLGIAAVAAVAVAGTAGMMYVRGQNAAPAAGFDLASATPSTDISSAISGDPARDVATVGDGSNGGNFGGTGGEGTNGELTNATFTLDTSENLEETQSVARTEAAPANAIANAQQNATRTPTPIVSTQPAIAEKLFSAPRIPSRISVRQAAQKGNRIAQLQAGLADLRAGRQQSGAALIKKAAEQGLPAAQYELAILHETGTGTTRDTNEAIKWHERAARGGNVQAMYDFATYNYNTQDPDGLVNPPVAAEWFRKAAEFGDTDSQFNLGQFYASGIGVTPSQVEAYFWYKLAAKGGDTEAGDFAAQLVTSGAVSQDAAAQTLQRVANWRAATPTAASNGKFGQQDWDRNPADQTLAVQKVLNALGYSVGRPDGAIGNQTRAAIRTFEADKGLPVTGSINDRLVDALNTAADAERRRI